MTFDLPAILLEPIRWRQHHPPGGNRSISPTAVGRAAICAKETAGNPDGVDSKELQFLHCGKFCKAHDFEIAVRYHDSVGNRANFDQLTGEAIQDAPPSDFVVVYKLRNCPWSLKEYRPLPGQSEVQPRHPRIRHWEAHSRSTVNQTGAVLTIGPNGFEM